MVELGKSLVITSCAFFTISLTYVYVRLLLSLRTTAGTQHQHQLNRFFLRLDSSSPSPSTTSPTTPNDIRVSLPNGTLIKKKLSVALSLLEALAFPVPYYFMCANLVMMTIFGWIIYYEVSEGFVISLSVTLTSLLLGGSSPAAYTIKTMVDQEDDSTSTYYVLLFVTAISGISAIVSASNRWKELFSPLLGLSTSRWTQFTKQQNSPSMDMDTGNLPDIDSSYGDTGLKRPTNDISRFDSDISDITMDEHFDTVSGAGARGVGGGGNGGDNGGGSIDLQPSVKFVYCDFLTLQFAINWFILRKEDPKMFVIMSVLGWLSLGTSHCVWVILRVAQNMR
ncbi:hypothetical protein ScalyP_jg9222 [Parmales sp. scaly parma]|nr:hypothetical protein ScalyP_jg9222 [Parmales sp. scaly parma]